MSEINRPDENEKEKSSENVAEPVKGSHPKYDPLRALDDFLGVKGEKTLIVGICDLEKDFRLEFRNVLEDKESFQGIKIDSYPINGLNPLLSFLVDKEPDVLIFGPSWDKQSISNFFLKNSEMRGKFMVLWASNSVRGDDEARDLIKNRVINHFIKLPVLVAELVEIVRSVITEAANKKLEAPKVQVVKPLHDANLVMVFAAKGGVGKTIISSNLAVYLAVRKFRTLLIDLDLQFGDAGLVLNLKPENTIADLCESDDFTGSDNVAGAMEIKDFITVHKSGLHVLHAPLSPEYADLINAQQVKKIVDIVRSNYDFVIFDTPATFNEVILSTLEMSDQVYLIANLDLPCVKNTKLAFDTLDLLGLGAKNVEVVINKFDNIGIDLHEVESVLDRKISITLPNDSNVLLAVNRGEPIIGAYPKSPFTKGFVAFAQKVEKVAGKVPGRAPQAQPVQAARTDKNETPDQQLRASRVEPVSQTNPASSAGRPSVDKPGQPSQQAQPGQPDQKGQPAQAGQPVKPVQPGQPGPATASGQPGASVKPAQNPGPAADNNKTIAAGR